MVNLQQYYLEQYLVERAHGAARRRPALEAPASSACSRTTTACGSRSRRRRPLRAGGRLAGGGRRRAQPDAPHAGPGHRGPGLPGPLPDRRRGDEGRLPGRALVLVRPAVPPRPERAAAPRGRQRLAHRLPARLGRRPRGREAARARRAARRARCSAPASAQFELEWVSVYTFQCRRMAALPPWPRAVRRRRGAPGVAVRRARRQLGRPGRRQPGLEARRW